MHRLAASAICYRVERCEKKHCTVRIQRRWAVVAFSGGQLLVANTQTTVISILLRSTATLAATIISFYD